MFFYTKRIVWRNICNEQVTVEIVCVINFNGLCIYEHFCCKKELPSLRKLQEIMMTSSNGDIFRVTGHFCGDFTGYR